MYYRKRAVLLLCGLVGSVVFAVILVRRNTEAKSRPVSFPYTIDSVLVIEGLVGYEGAFVEKGNEEVVDVAGAIVTNCSDQIIQEARIHMECQTGSYEFEVSYLPPGTSTLALEVEAKIWTKDLVLSCDVEYAFGLGIPDGLLVQQMEDGVVALTNTTEYSINNIRIYHKNWAKEAGMFLGGIAYETYAGDLEPGQFVFLKPEFYVSGMSQIIAATKY